MIQYTYDDLNRLSKVEYQNGVTIGYKYDAVGNRLTKKVFSENNPNIFGSPTSYALHYTDIHGYEIFGINFFANVSDPQGASAISSVKVTDPDGKIYELYDDGAHCDNQANDNNYGLCINNFYKPVPTGVYIFTATDEDNNTSKPAISNVNRILDVPGNLSPKYMEIVKNESPTFSWNVVNDAVEYRLTIFDQNGNQIWHRSNISDTSISYNDDNQGVALIETNTYQWNVYASDHEGNHSWCNNIPFVYNPDPPDLNSGLIAFYLFNGNVIDESGNGNNGVIHGCTIVSDRNENPNSAFYFDGDDYIEIPDSNTLDITKSISISAWVNLTNVYNGAILSKGTDDSNESFFLTAIEPIRWHINSSSGWIWFDGKEKLQFENWYHVAATFDGNRVQIFLNGTNNGYAEASGTIITNDFSLTIGKRGGDTHWWQGSIDDICIYNRVLSDSEVKSLYNGDKPEIKIHQIPQSERHALIALYNNTNGDGWINKTNWLGEEDTECTWYGIECNNEKTHITSIVLNGNQLNGRIPSELGSLTNLVKLFLNDNQLIGDIPAELNNCSNLSALYLHNNQLNYNLPSNLNNLSSLSVLSLRNNSLFTGGTEFSKPTLVDIDDDSDFDLFIVNGDGNIHFYQNDGNAYIPSWSFITENYGGILAYRKLTFTDIDADGDYDLFFGNNNQISYYQNDGDSSNPIWHEITQQYASILADSFLSPAFTDIDKDGDYDLFVAERDGNIHYYQNDGNSNSPIWILKTESYQKILLDRIDSISFVDIDADGDQDLFIGDNSKNSIIFYRNDLSTPSSNWLYIDNKHNDLQGNGCCLRLDFADIDGDGDLDAFAGSHWIMNLYINLGTPNMAIWSLSKMKFPIIDLNGYASPNFVDIDNDGDNDMFSGNVHGNIFYYPNIGNQKSPIWDISNIIMSLPWTNHPSSFPEFVDIDNDNDFDLFIGEGGWDNNYTGGGKIHFYRNDGTINEPKWTFVTEQYNEIDVGAYSVPRFVDIDNDNDYDLFVGNKEGKLIFFRNNGSATNPIWGKAVENYALIDVGEYSAPEFFDIDNDNDYDLFIGEYNGSIYYYKNIGSSHIPNWKFITPIFKGIDVGKHSVPTFVNIDDNLKIDLFVGEEKGGIRYFENVYDNPEDYQIPQTERQSLISLFNNTGGDNWITKTNWLGDEGTECAWYGIECSNMKTHIAVTSINLANNKLSGSIPKELENFTGLQKLDLGHNQLSGNIPSEIGKLTELNLIRLPNNLLSGKIPTEIGNLINLTTMIFSGNQLTGIIPVEIGKLKNLQSIDLGSNQLTGNIPSELGNLKNLKFLFIDNNQFTGGLPSELGDLNQLIYFFAFSNKLTGEIPVELSNLTGLKYLHLGNNKLTGNIPSELGNLSNLRELYLFYNEITGSIPSRLSLLNKLTKLYLNANQLTGNIPTEISDITTLRIIDISNNDLLCHNNTDFILTSKAKGILVNCKFGDINSDGMINLLDVMLALQVASGVEPFFTVYKELDTSSDNKIGIEEAIYILQAVSKNICRSPVLNHIGNKHVSTGNLLEFVITVNNIDGNKLFFSAENLPNGATFDINTHKFNWIPGSEQIGIYDVTFYVSDDCNPSLNDSEQIKITVENK